MRRLARFIRTDGHCATMARMRRALHRRGARGTVRRSPMELLRFGSPCDFPSDYRRRACAVRDARRASRHGFDDETIERLREYADFEIRQEIIPWTGILPGGTTGKYDIAITAALITPERAEVLGFTSPIADAAHYYVKRADDESIEGIADLDGKRIGVQAGSAMLARLPELQAMLDESGGTLGEITEYTSYPEAYQDLAQGRTDVVINPVINLQALASSRPDVFALGQAVSGASYPGWAVRKGNDELLAYMNAFLAEMKADGTMPPLQEKWFGRSFDLPVDYTPDF